jgi:O-antigen ligase
LSRSYTIGSYYAASVHDHAKENGIAVALIYLISISYFYVLPLTRISTVATTDFRAYDLLIAMAGFLVILPRLKEITRAISRYPWIKHYMLFCCWAFLTLWIVYLYRGLALTVIATARWSRFLAFGLVHSAILVLIKERKHLVRLTWIFLLLSFVEAMLTTFQSLGLLPQLWPGYWVAVYGDIPVGTLGLHHIHAGTIAVLGVSLGIAFLRHYKSLLLRLFLSVSMAAMIYSTFAVESRSGWLGLAVVIAYFGLVAKGKRISLIALLAIVFGVWVFVQLSGERVSVVAEEVIDRRLITIYQSGGLVGLDQERIRLWQDAVTGIINKPWFFITGAGLQNSSIILRVGGAVHNNYLHVLLETGIIGLILYVRMLFFTFKRSKTVERNTNSMFGRNLATGFQSGFIAILILNLFNENFYMQYSSFSLTGQILVYAALALHPLWLEDSEEDPMARRIDNPHLYA